MHKTDDTNASVPADHAASLEHAHRMISTLAGHCERLQRRLDGHAQRLTSHDNGLGDAARRHGQLRARGAPGELERNRIAATGLQIDERSAPPNGPRVCREHAKGRMSALVSNPNRARVVRSRSLVVATPLRRARRRCFLVDIAGTHSRTPARCAHAPRRFGPGFYSRPGSAAFSRAVEWRAPWPPGWQQGAHHPLNVLSRGLPAPKPALAEVAVPRNGTLGALGSQNRSRQTPRAHGLGNR